MKKNKVKVVMQLLFLAAIIFIQTGCASNREVMVAKSVTAIETSLIQDSVSNENQISNSINLEHVNLSISPPSIRPKDIDKPAEKALEDHSMIQSSLNINANSNGLNVLKGKIICIDPGHGFPNHAIKTEPNAPSSDIMKPATAYGTSGVATKIPEYKLTMAVSLKLRDALSSAGAQVVMTRESNDTDLGNIERAEIGNKSLADLSLRIHADGIDSSSVTGISVLTPGNQYIKDKALLSNSKKAASMVLSSVIKSTNAKSRGVIERNDLTGFNWSKVPVILIEVGFMTNPEEDRKLNTDDYQNKIVEGIVHGLSTYFLESK